MSRTMIIEESKNAFIEALFQLLKSESFEHITVKPVSYTHLTLPTNSLV